MFSYQAIVASHREKQKGRPSRRHRPDHRASPDATLAVPVAITCWRSKARAATAVFSYHAILWSKRSGEDVQVTVAIQIADRTELGSMW